MSRSSARATRRAAMMAPSEGSMPTTRYPLRAAAIDQRPQLQPMSRNVVPLRAGGSRSSGIG